MCFCFVSIALPASNDCLFPERIYVDINRPERTPGALTVRKCRDIPGRKDNHFVDGYLISGVIDCREVLGTDKIKPTKGMFKARCIGRHKVAIVWPALTWPERYDNAAAEQTLNPAAREDNDCIVKCLRSTLNDFTKDPTRNKNQKTLLLEFPDGVELHPEVAKATEKCKHDMDLKLELCPVDHELKSFLGDDINFPKKRKVMLKDGDTAMTDAGGSDVRVVYVVQQSAWRVMYRVPAEQTGRITGEEDEEEETEGLAALREALGS